MAPPSNKLDGAVQIFYTVPGPVYFGTKASIEALTGIQSGAFAIGYTTTLADGQFGFFDGAAWHWDTGGGGTPGGSDTEIQVNDSGAFAGYPTFRRQANGAIVIGDIDEDITIEPYSIGQGADGSSIANFLESFGTSVASYIAFLRARGTHDAPEAVQNGDVIGRIRGRAHDGTGWSSTQAEIRIVADGDWSAGDHPARIEIYTTLDGSDTLTLVMTIQSDGNIDIASGKEYRVDGTNVMEGTWLRVEETWTRTGNHTFTVSGDLTARYRKGAALKYNDGAIDYGRIASSSHSSGTTTVNLIPNTSYVMAATTITDTYISYSQNPEGMPETFNFTSTASSSVGALGAVTQNVGYWALRGKSSIQVTTAHTITDVGTGSGVFRATGPVNAAAYSAGLGRENAMTGHQTNTVIDGGSNLIQQRKYDNGSLVVVNYQCAQTTIYPF